MLSENKICISASKISRIKPDRSKMDIIDAATRSDKQFQI